MEAQKNEVFRYILNIQDSKILEGKYHFLVQLNIDRGYKRRSPENIISMNQPFNEKDFNFTKLVSEEQIMNLNNIDKDDIIAINASPIEYCHSLLLPQRCKQLPQLVTKHSLVKAVELFSLSLSSYIRVAFNSLCAFASVNHLHWHLYYLKWRMLLEYIGELIINAEMEDLQNYIMMDAVPPSWTKRVYPSKLGLNSWFTDMLYRINELSDWAADFNFMKLIIESVGNFDAWNSTQTGKINIAKLNERQNKASFNAHDCCYP
ncbi:GDP-D-glucose phosphorylase 1-like isoform X2 [Bombus terrestris]|nr:GDP-D-glucose phosphorylase 1-like isoform X2 [Bombus terrestris]XP_048269553.1 GDP-D-glucose phosphorylase 1-like isoform X2 [Bombus terrestris]XP_048269554.1 GDP-D-glucose phosphorylase 1-like isoform X2 [Bombus terrestris]XP_048269555.1 GDP-D-glucose phosphorylase 1-like isoform X2 [Bombus terrestris]